MWKNTVESLEYRHDKDYDQNQFANGAHSLYTTNSVINGTGASSDMLTAQIAVYF